MASERSAEHYRKPDDSDAAAVTADALATGLALKHRAAAPPIEPKLPRFCECGCGQQIPATARADKRTINVAHRMRWMRLRQAAA
jgi:hypothetical protein